MRSASLKNQAYASYFYGKNGVIEDVLSWIEHKIAGLLRAIDRTERIPRRRVEQIALKAYILLQAERTRFSAESLDESVDKLLHLAFKEDPRVKKYLPGVRIGLKEPAALKLSIAFKLIPLVFDLEMVLLINESNRSFVTSDNPVVKYNQFMEKRKWPGGWKGWATVGLQVFFPISKRLMFFMYDRQIYRTRSSRKRGLIRVKNVVDVNRLNGLQFLNANENVYFDESTDEFQVRRLDRRYRDKKRPERVWMQEFHEVNPNSNSKTRSSLIASHEYNLVANLVLSFLFFRRRATKRKLGPTMANVRKEWMLDFSKQRPHRVI